MLVMTLAFWKPSTTPIEEIRTKLDARRNGTPLQKLHHHVWRCRDAAETRRFYEELLELPLVAAVVEMEDPYTKEPTPYVHLYFEFGDGSWLAFFDFPAHFEKTGEAYENYDVWAHHIAIRVKDQATVDRFKAKVEDAGLDLIEADHGYCRSIYFHDPNGLCVEITTNVPETERYFADKERDIDADMARWQEVKETYLRTA